MIDAQREKTTLAKLIFIVLCVFICYQLIKSEALGVNVDFYTYNTYIQESRDLQTFRFKNVEIGFVIASHILTYFGLDTLTCLAIFGAASASIKLFVFSKSDRFYSVVLLYAILLFPLHEYTQIRTALATSLIYLFLYLLRSRRRVIHLLALLSSTLFHYVSFVSVITFIVLRLLQRFNKRSGILLSLLLALIIYTVFNFSDILLPNSNIENYRFIVYDSSIPILTAQNIVIISIIILTRFFSAQRDIEYNFVWAIVAITVPMAILFSDNPVFSNRFREYGFAFVPYLYCIFKSQSPIAGLAVRGLCFLLALLMLNDYIANSIIEI